MVQLAILRELLDGWGYDSAGVIESWGRRGWLLQEKGRRTRDARIAGERARCVVMVPGAPERPSLTAPSAQK
jgi:hypothetical protein